MCLKGGTKGKWRMRRETEVVVGMIEVEGEVEQKGNIGGII